MTSQTSLGNFPPSFLATPDLIANYHFGFIFIAGSISYIFSLAPIYSIYFSILLIFLNIALMCFILYSKYNSLKNVFLFICLILFTASFPTIYLIKNINNFVTWYTYLNVIEYFSSTSWLLGFLSIGILTYFSLPKKCRSCSINKIFILYQKYTLLYYPLVRLMLLFTVSQCNLFTLMVLIAYLISSKKFY